MQGSRKFELEFKQLAYNRVSNHWYNYWVPNWLITPPSTSLLAVHSPDWDGIDTSGQGTIASVTLGNPTIITMTNNLANAQTGDSITLAGFSSTLGTALNGTRTITVTGANTFTVAVNTTGLSTYTSGATAKTISSIGEGLGYALKIAQYLGDKVNFDKLWTYWKGRTNYSNLNLHYWRWDVTNNHAMVTSSVVAPDGEEEMIEALLKANDKWGWGSTYANDGMSKLQDLYRYCTVSYHGKHLLLSANPGSFNPANDMFVYPDYFSTGLWNYGHFCDPAQGQSGGGGWLKMIQDAQTISLSAANTLTGGRFNPGQCSVHTDLSILTAGDDTFDAESCRKPWRDLKAFRNFQNSDTGNYVRQVRFLRDYAVNTLPNAGPSSYASSFAANGTANIVTSGNNAFYGSCAAVAYSYILDGPDAAYFMYNRLLEPCWSHSSSAWTQVGGGIKSSYFDAAQIDMTLIACIEDLPTPANGTWSTLTPTGSVAGIGPWFNTDRLQNQLGNSGTSYQQLTDQSSNGFNFSQGTAALQPTIGSLNGKDVMQFDGATQYIDINTAGLAGFRNISGLFMAFPFQLSSNAGQNTLINLRFSGGSFVLVYIDGTNLNYTFFGRRLGTDSAGTLNSSNNVVTLNSPTLFSANLDYVNGVVRFFQNGACIQESTSGTITSGGNSDNTQNLSVGHIGFNNTTGYFKGLIGSPVFAVNTTHTYNSGFLSASKSSIEVPLAQKYGINLY